MSLARVKLAAAVTPGEVIAMESADDAEGFLWCLPEPKVLLSATKVRRRLWMGLRLWTVDITYYCVNERFPPNSPDIFKLSAHIYKENAEGVISRSVIVTEVAVRRSVRANTLLYQYHR
jgi:hypothetical protein